MRTLTCNRQSPLNLPRGTQHRAFRSRCLLVMQRKRAEQSMNAFGREAIRQQKETFDQLRRQDRQWFALRLTMGYSAVVLLLAVLAVSGLVLFGGGRYPEFVVRAASATLFADVVGLLFGIWKIALNPTFHNRLRPV